ncbi:hypothetical protein HMPREF0239_03044 [Clostridium sp. ATCC BAA-442]|nr:hypothetical protein HMPREF0239_03044 [Clostridium sp. ATCC BAA-442]
MLFLCSHKACSPLFSISHNRCILERELAAAPRPPFCLKTCTFLKI